jgi:hypothetical protein
MSGIKKFSELSKEELIKRMSRACCYKCETFVEYNKYWSCQDCECVCCDSCVEEGDVDNEELEEDCGFYCEECREKFLKEKEEEKEKKKVEEKESDEEVEEQENICDKCGVEDDDVFVHPFGCVRLCSDCGKGQCPLEKHGKNTEDHCEVCYSD